MARISDAEIASVAAAAGFGQNDLATAVAVALAESGGNPLAHNRSEPDGSQSFGLWQINSVHSDLLSSGNWRDPASNARMAFVIFQRRGWTAWGAFNNLSYRLFLTRGQVAASTVDSSGSANVGFPNPLAPIDSAKDAIEQVGRLFAFITDRHNWLRVTTVLVGSVLLGIVAMRIVRASSTYRRVRSVATTVATRGIATGESE